MCLVKQKNVLDFFHLCIVKNAPICYTAQKQQYTCPLEPISKIPRVSKSNFFTEPMEFAERLPVPMKNFKFARFGDANSGSPSLLNRPKSFLNKLKLFMQLGSVSFTQHTGLTRLYYKVFGKTHVYERLQKCTLKSFCAISLR